MTVDYFLTLAEVRARVKLGRTTIYRWMGEGRFPKQVSLASQVVRWRQSDVDRWMANPKAWDQNT